MKKLLIILFMAILSLSANAQGVWSTGVNAKDESKGLAGGPYYCYDVEGIGSFVLWDWDDWNFRIMTDNGRFHAQIADGRKIVAIWMGLYAPSSQLVEEVQCPIEPDQASCRTASVNKDWIYSISTRKKIKKMIHALRSGEGYVRIISQRDNMKDFDLTITKYDITEENSNAYKEFPQVFNHATIFCDVNDYSTPYDISVAMKNSNLKSTTLKKGERFKVLSLDTKTMSAKIQLTNGKVGWIDALHVPDPKDFLPYVKFRNEYLLNLQAGTVAPGMSREEVYIVTGNYLNPSSKSYKAFGDYIWYVYTNGSLLFYKNSLYFASNFKGAFYYECFPHYKLISVSRNETEEDKNISSNIAYKDELLSISWKIGRNKLDFMVKNNAASSMKIQWDDVAFVGLNGESHRVIHKSIKYSEKEREQAPSVIARNTELFDCITPTDYIYFQKTWNKWAAYPFVNDYIYSPEDQATRSPNDKKIQVLLPVIINEKRYEYQFVFEIDNMNFSLYNSDYYKSSRIADEL